MDELTNNFFSMLQLAKTLHDHGIDEKMGADFSGQTLDEDMFYELAYCSIDYIFPNACGYYNENDEVETWVVTDPIIDRFCRLCQEYETKQGIEEKDDPFRCEADDVIRSAIQYQTYHEGFDWRLSASDRGRKRILFFLDAESYLLERLPVILLDIQDGFLDLNQRLEKVLGYGDKILQLPLPAADDRKEAA